MKRVFNFVLFASLNIRTHAMKEMQIAPIVGKFTSFTRSFIVALFLLTGIPCFAQNLSLTVGKPGQITKQIKGKENSIVSLTISGVLNGKDMEAVYALPNLVELNLKDASLQEGAQFTLTEGKTKRKMSLFSSRFPFLFSSNLKTLHLPESVDYILTRNEILESLFSSNLKTSHLFPEEESDGDYIHTRNLVSEKNIPIANYEDPQLDNLYLYGSKSAEKAEQMFKVNNKITKNLHLTDVSSFSRYGVIEEYALNRGNIINVIDTLYLYNPKKLPQRGEMEKYFPSVIVYNGMKILVRWTGNKPEITREDLAGFRAIYPGAFLGHTEIKNVSIPSNIKVIPYGCFRGLSLESITMDAVEKIEGNAFSAKEIFFNMPIAPSFSGMSGEFNAALIHIPRGARDKYQLGNWKGIIVHEEGENTNYEFVVEKPGTLNQYLTTDVIASATSLTLTGILYDTDMKVLDQCKGLRMLDLTKTIILESPETAKKKREEAEDFFAAVGLMFNLGAAQAEHDYNKGHGNIADAIGTKALASYFNELMDMPRAEIKPSEECLSPSLNLPQLEEIRLPIVLKNLKSICTNKPNLKRIQFPAAMETMSSSAFNGCKSLEKLELPSTLKEITKSKGYNSEDNASGWNNLKILDLSKTQLSRLPDDWLSEVFEDKSTSIEKIFLPKALEMKNVYIKVSNENECDIYIPVSECGSFVSFWGRKIRVHIPKGYKVGWSGLGGNATVIDDL